MPAIYRRAALGLMIAALAGCGTKAPSPRPAARPKPQFSGNTPQMQQLIKRYARAYDIPESLIHRVIRRESGYRPEARNGSYYGLMQIAPQTAATMGYR
ncbi:MAG: transglycosylase SLT domain-containing protein, partial [Albidovulum sp.]